MKGNGRKKRRAVTSRPAKTVNPIQEATDRVLQMEKAVKDSQHNLSVCEQEHQKCRLALDEAYRNLCDTSDLLKAQQHKLDRERQALVNRIWAVPAQDGFLNSSSN